MFMIIKQTSTDVLIIGGGPVGLALALTLAKKYGIRSIVIEKRTEPTPTSESRAIVWMPKGIEFLEWLGILDTFERMSIRRTRHRFVRHGKPLLTLDFRLARSKFAFSLNLAQHDTEHILETEVRKYPDLIEIRRGHEFISCEEDTKNVHAKVTDTTTGKGYDQSASLLVGCDGAKSIVREAIGIALDWKDYGTFSAVADIEAKLPEENPDMSWIELDYHRPYGLFNFGRNRWRIIYRVNDDETREEAASHSFVEKLISMRFPQIHSYELLWASVFRLGQGQSRQYSKGRVILAGDAAHPMGPSAGAGMMVGMLGVWRLGWRIRHALNARGSTEIENIFSSYEKDQREGSKMIQATNSATFAQIALKNPVLAALRRVAFWIINRSSFVQRRMVVADTLTDQEVEWK